MDFDGIEKLSDGTKRTLLYFAHPYCANKRGTNENRNRMFRRFYPKGMDFSKLSPKLFIANCLLKRHPEPEKRIHKDEHS